MNAGMDFGHCVSEHRLPEHADTAIADDAPIQPGAFKRAAAWAADHDRAVQVTALVAGYVMAYVAGCLTGLLL